MKQYEKLKKSPSFEGEIQVYKGIIIESIYFVNRKLYKMQNGYGICLNEWLFDDRIKNELRFLVYISSLCAEKGYCYASNAHFSEKFKIHETNVSKNLKKLENIGYITITYERRGSTIVNRNIRLAKTLTDDWGKRYPTVSENAKENITSNNNIKNNISSLRSDILQKSEENSENLRESKPNLPAKIENDSLTYLRSISEQIDNGENPEIPEYAQNVASDFMDFLLYWTEKDANGRIRASKEKTFEVKRRFYTWMKRRNDTFTFTPIRKQEPPKYGGMIRKPGFDD